STRWAAVAGKASTIYKYIGSADESRDLSTQDFTSSDWLEIAGNPGSVYEYLGITDFNPTTSLPNTTTDLSGVDYSNLGYWKEVPVTNLIPQGLNLTDSDSIGIAGLVVSNEVRSEVLATIHEATVDAVLDVKVDANNETEVAAVADSAASSSGGSAYGSGKSIAVNGVVATN
ncbi:MAG: hypothetical protein GY904_26615, partial [Planctomycetaceae bacterium]|nr:hypothetical protein [Planctomycetaceae bacterium]